MGSASPACTRCRAPHLSAPLTRTMRSVAACRVDIPSDTRSAGGFGARCTGTTGRFKIQVIRGVNDTFDNKLELRYARTGEFGPLDFEDSLAAFSDGDFLVRRIAAVATFDDRNWYEQQGVFLQGLVWILCVKVVVFFVLGTRYRRRALVPSGPCIVVANHNSHLDAALELDPTRRRATS